MSDAVAEDDARRRRDEPDFRRYWWARLLSSAGTIASGIVRRLLLSRRDVVISPKYSAAIADSRRLGMRQVAGSPRGSRRALQGSARCS
jgi:hypothetical protein